VEWQKMFNKIKPVNIYLFAIFTFSLFLFTLAGCDIAGIGGDSSTETKDNKEAINSPNLLDIPALLKLDFDGARATLDQHFADPPTIEGPKEYMGTEMTIYAYVEILEDSLVGLSVAIVNLEDLLDEMPFIYVSMGTMEGFPMDYDLDDLYRFTNLDPNSTDYSLEDIEVTDNLISLIVRQ
jgi:hypothetical protein